jgi:hypothetical protein
MKTLTLFGVLFLVGAAAYLSLNGLLWVGVLAIVGGVVLGGLAKVRA